MEGDFNDIDSREDNIDREVRKLIKRSGRPRTYPAPHDRASDDAE
jgi:hypothetical protein